jgi:hypothetical protein
MTNNRLRKLEEKALEDSSNKRPKLRKYLTRTAIGLLVTGAASLGHLSFNQAQQSYLYGEPINQWASEYKMRYTYTDKVFHNYLAHTYLNQPLRLKTKNNPNILGYLSTQHKLMWGDIATASGFALGAYWIIRRRKVKKSINKGIDHISNPDNIKNHALKLKDWLTKNKK